MRRDHAVRFLQGARNSRWRGDAAQDTTKRQRAKRAYPDLDVCERCGKLATERHHKNEDTGDNRRENLEFLCRRCHMIIDGRLEALRRMGSMPKPKSPKRPCINCGRPWKPLRRGRCGACNEYLRRKGIERPLALERRLEKIRQNPQLRMFALPEVEDPKTRQLDRERAQKPATSGAVEDADA